MTEAAAAAQLSEYDFHVIVDMSGSMERPVKAGSTRTRWVAVQETAEQIVRRLAAIDTDGVDMIFFGGDRIRTYKNTTGETIAKAFAENKPSGSTPLAEALTEALREAGRNPKKDFVVVFTDGVPDEKVAAANVIKKQANSQEVDDACTILFVQVGDDPEAAAYLKSLDDDLKGAKFDIVDAKTQAEAEAYSSIEELLLAAITD